MSWRRFANWAKHKPIMLQLADRLGRSRGRLAVIDRLVPAPRPNVRLDLSNWERHTLAAAWIGHATVLLRIGGLTILTDPVFSARVGVGLGILTAGPKRLLAPAVELTDLPALDLILISHAHFDHLDRPTLARLPKKTPIITAAATRDLLTDLGYRNVRELRWNRRLTVGDVTIDALRPNHWGARTFHDMNRGYNAYVLRDGVGRSILYGADTAETDAFDGIGPVDLAILGIGAYDPYVAAHTTPEQAWGIAQRIPARHLLPMHHSTFVLSHEPVDEPMQRLLAAMDGQADKIVVREVGGMWKMP